MSWSSFQCACFEKCNTGKLALSQMTDDTHPQLAQGRPLAPARGGGYDPLFDWVTFAVDDEALQQLLEEIALEEAREKELAAEAALEALRNATNSSEVEEISQEESSKFCADIRANETSGIDLGKQVLEHISTIENVLIQAVPPAGLADALAPYNEVKELITAA